MMSPLSARGGRGGRKGKRGVPFFLLSSLLSISISSSTVAAAAGFKPKAQFCKFGHSKSEIDFCMGLSTLSNNSTSHLSLSIRKSFSKGWTAVGTGESMTDSLMFIVYGDPESADSRAPVVSVRTAGGHEKPRPVNFLSINGDEVKGVDFFASGGGAGAGTGGGKVKVVKAAWERLGGHEGNTKDHNKKKRHEDEDEETESTQGKEPKYAARVEIVCEGCNWEDDATKWGSRGDVMPWIWAWNERQDFTESERGFDVAAGLHMHRHHEGSGGFGRFWVDLGRAKVAESEEAKWDGGSEMDWSVFEAKQENERIGTSDLPPAGSGGGAGGWMRNWSWAKFHGLMMAIGFLCMFPAGVVIIRMSNDGKSEKKGSSSSSPFKRHWRVQMAATVLAVAGGVTGGVISRWRMPRTVHQWLGASILMGLLIQSILGWRHHMVFLRIKRRTWISHAHIWLGRAIVLGGLVNILLGMLLSGHEVSSVAFVGAVVLAEVVGLGYFVWRAQRRAEVERQLALLTSEVEGHALMPRESNVGNDYFAVGMSQDDSDDDNDDTDRRRLRKKPEVHEARSSADAKV